MDQATSATDTMEEVGTASASPIEDFLIDLHQRISDVGGGKVADYIPELGRAAADTFGMALATVDGETYATGDADRLFSIQSVSKPFMYGYALQHMCSAMSASSRPGRRSTRSCSTRSPTGRSTRWSMPAPLPRQRSCPATA